MGAASCNTVDDGPGDAVAAVVAGKRFYDTLDNLDQTVVRTLWPRIDARLESLDLRAELEASGVTHAELRDGGEVVGHRPAS